MSVPTLHERVARRWSWARRATLAAALAAVASVVGWAAAAPPAVHGGAIVASALVGMVWPQRDRRPLALRWVGTRAGLAYETAVEAGDRSDVLGLLDAVRTQGRLAIRDVAVPEPAPWWVPAALLAATLWFWGAFVGVPWSPPWAPGPGTSATPPGPTVAPPPTEEPEALPPPDATDGADDVATERADEASDAGPGGEGGAGEGGGAPGGASERDALERFVDGLRERETEAAAAATEQAADDSGEEPDRTPGGERDEGSEMGAAPPEPGGEGDPDGAQDGAEEGAEDGAGESAEDGEGDERGEGAEADGGEPDPDGTPEATDEEAGAGEEGAGEGAAGLEPGADPGEAGFGAGEAGDAADAVDEDPRAPDALPSVLGDGPETPIGGVALPGAEGDGAFPAGEAGAGYRRAVEEALTEGEVPVSYQEVIRNYFR